jgi:hypothetical protein
MNSLSLTAGAAVERGAARPAAAGTFATFAKAVRALGEGFTAYRRYEVLRARGVPHAVAAAQAFEA